MIYTFYLAGKEMLQVKALMFTERMGSTRILPYFVNNPELQPCTQALAKACTILDCTKVSISILATGQRLAAPSRVMRLSMAPLTAPSPCYLGVLTSN